jgi:uncharacterized lipoprotein YbaY
MTQRTIRGTIHLPPAAELPPGATTRVRVIDVSAADADAQVVTESVIHDIAGKAARGEALTFELDVDLDPRPVNSYAVSVHVDALDDGRLKTGDLITMQRYPVNADEPEQHLDIEVKKI